MKESKEKSKDRKSTDVKPMKSPSNTRRRRIMRQLGLMPPIGSPFALPNSSEDQKKKVPFERVFTEQDEIHILDSILSLKTISNSPSPQIPTSMLFDRVKDSLGCVVNQSQLRRKARHLRQSYHHQVSSNAQFKNPHEQAVFEMSSKIWGGESANQRGLNDGSASMAPKIERSIEDLEKKYPHLMEEASRLPAMAKEGLQRLSSMELAGLNQRWRAQRIEEAKVLGNRDRLIQERNSLILEAIED